MDTNQLHNLPTNQLNMLLSQTESEMVELGKTLLEMVNQYEAKKKLQLELYYELSQRIPR